MNRIIEYFDEQKHRQVATVQERTGGLYFAYHPQWTGNTLDPSLPLAFSGFLSAWQLEGLMDKLPIPSNPRYPEYCQKWGIDARESDPLILLCTTGHRTVCHAICRPCGWKPGIWSQLMP